MSKFNFTRLFWVALYFISVSLNSYASENETNDQLEKKLPVTELRQKYPFSCEAAALRIMLDYYGIKLTEDQIIKKMPQDKTPRKNGIWGDPNKAFVGDIYGKNSEVSYGIHWYPLRDLANKWIRAEADEDAQLSDLVSHLTSNRPVLAWVNDGTGKELKWKTAKGKEISAIEGEHTVVVYGFRGPAAKPTGFFIMDPNHGPQFKETADFERVWNKLGKAYLVLYGKKNGS